MRVVLASANPDKAAEIIEIVSPLGTCAAPLKLLSDTAPRARFVAGVPPSGCPKLPLSLTVRVFVAHPSYAVGRPLESTVHWIA